MRKKIAITGGIGSGKSTLLQIIKESGYDVYSCDNIYQNILTKEEYVAEIEKLFPNAVSKNIIDKEALAKIIFNDKIARKQLNDIAHPLVMRELEKKMNESFSDLVFAEVPLLFESGFENLFDNVIVLMRDEATRIQSVIARDKTTSVRVRKRMDAQVDYQSKELQKRLRQCNAYIIHNDGNIDNLRKQLDAFLNT